MSARRTQPDSMGSRLRTRTHSAVFGPIARSRIPFENDPTTRALASGWT
jgi:hypothetical protein